MKAPELTLLAVDVFDTKSGTNRHDAIRDLLTHAQNSGREAWTEFNGTMIKARPDDTQDQIDSRWLLVRSTAKEPYRLRGVVVAARLYEAPKVEYVGNILERVAKVEE
jgi:hypothetical protein